MSDGPLSPEEVAHRGFGTTFRGFDTAEVRAYLQRVANDLRDGIGRERDLHRRLADAEYRAAHPVLEGDALTRALGDEMGRILVSAQEAANGLKDKAEENAARILREAHDRAQRIRAQAEAILAVRTEEADAEGAEIRKAAEVEAAQLLARADEQASAAMAEVEGRARQLVHDAQAARARVLGDLTRRRRLLQTQVEQLRAGRDRLLEAYRKVRSTTDEVAHELQRVEDEAREAAGAAGERVAAGAADDDIDEVLLAFAEAEAEARAGATAVPDGPEGGDGGTAAGAAQQQPGEGPSPPAGSVPFAVKADVAAHAAAQAADDAEEAALAAEAAAVEAAQGADGDDAGPPPQRVSTRPGGERRPLRLLRRPRSETPSLDEVAAPSEGEVVRVLPPPPEPVVEAAASSVPAATVAADPPQAADDQEPAVEVGEAPAAPPEEAPGPPPDAGTGRDEAAPAATGAPDADRGEAEVAAAAVAGVDELFARIRAGRADAVARAHEVLAADPEATVQPASAPPEGPAPADAQAAGAPAGPALDEALLQRRDAAVEGLDTKLARKLKRALQDEQNEVLDRLRSLKADASPEAVLPAPDGQAARFRQAAEDPLSAAAAAGVAFVAESGGSPADGPDVGGVLTELVSSLAEPLRRALERAVRGDGADQAAVGERVGAAYRECKAQRIEGLAGDAVTAAFSLGALAAMPAGAASQWVVDDGGRPCPDCDDNALAGPTPAGETFPTGQAHPPAHAGCRCLLAPSALSAAGSGSG